MTAAKAASRKILEAALGRARGLQTRKGNEMSVASIRNSIRLALILLAAGLGLAPAIFAQYGGGGGMRQQPMPQQQPPQQQPMPGSQQPPAQPPADAPKLDPEEETAYKAFYETKPDALDQQVKLGEQFVQKYPTSHYSGEVYARLTNAYFAMQKYDKMYEAGDKALSTNPDDIRVLTLIGWVIPHNYDPNDLDAERRLDKAEKYETHALAIIPTLTKPAGLTDDQFEKGKAEALGRAHSGLGLVYFRRQQYDNSVKELQAARQADTQPDAVDYYVMGVELVQLKRPADAANAFQKCGEIPGGLQGRCKQMADQSKKDAAAQPATAKP
jgi:tetratricopeptide (TPR) repeat protein